MRAWSHRPPGIDRVIGASRLSSGIVAAAIYTAVVLVAGYLTPGYSHVAQPVSSLYESGARGGQFVAAAFVVYNVFVVAFALALARTVEASAAPRKRVGLAAAWSLVLTGVAGAIDAVVPQDPIGAALTTTGTLHIVFAALASLLTMVAIGLFSAWCLARPAFRGLGWYSMGSLVVIFVSGGAAAAATAGGSNLMGLAERGAIFGFEVWLFVVSAVLTRKREPGP